MNALVGQKRTSSQAGVTNTRKATSDTDVSQNNKQMPSGTAAGTEKATSGLKMREGKSSKANVDSSKRRKLSPSDDHDLVEDDLSSGSFDDSDDSANGDGQGSSST